MKELLEDEIENTKQIFLKYGKRSAIRHIWVSIEEFCQDKHECDSKSTWFVQNHCTPTNAEIAAYEFCKL